MWCLSKLTIATFTVLALGGVEAFQYLSPSATATSTTIRIGVNYAKDFNSDQVTPQGSDQYRNTVHAMNLWLDYLSSLRNPELLPGASVQLVLQPHSSTIASGIVTSLDLLNSGVVGLIGSSYSGITKSTTILADSRNVPQCDGSASSPDLSNKAAYPRFFRTMPNDNIQAMAIFDFIHSMGWRRVAIISETEAYGAGLTEIFKRLINGKPISVVSQYMMEIGSRSNTTAWETCFQGIRDANAFVVVVFAVNDNIPGLIEAAMTAGMMSKKYVWIGSDGMMQNKVLAATGFLTAFPSDGDGPAFDKYNELWAANANAIATVDKSLPLYGTNFASCADLLVRGFDRYMVAAAQVNASVSMVDLAAGRFNTNFSKPALMFNFPDTYIPSGKIALDPNTADPCSSYDIFNVQGQGAAASFVRVGAWDGATRTFTWTSAIKYGVEASTDKPADNILVSDFTSLVSPSSGMGATAIACNIVAILMIIGTALFFVVKRHDPIVRKSSVPSMLLILVGLFLPCLDVFTMVGVPTTVHCIADIWLIGLGFAFVLGAITTKLLRLYRIFNGIAASQKGISNFDITIQTGGVVMVEAAILLAWTVIDAPKPTLLQINPLSYYYVCSSSSAKFHSTMTAILVGWNGLMLLICTTLAVATRNLRADFNEAKIVGVCVYNQLVVISLSILLLTTGMGSLMIGALFVIKQAAILIVVLVTLVAIHGSKMYVFFSGDDGSKGKSILPGVGNLTWLKDADSDSDSEPSQSSMTDADGMAIPGDAPAGRTGVTRRRTYASFKVPRSSLMNLWISAEVVHVPSLDVIVLRRTKLHVHKGGGVRASYGAMQEFVDGPQLFLRMLPGLKVSIDAVDLNIVHVNAEGKLFLSMRADDAMAASELKTLIMLGSRRLRDSNISDSRGMADHSA
ncbi:periplasmic binding protein-like I [Entophlyctis helioformis]|nr:periplasmic binding protein-like I [Entophlyctis helioformis]